MVPWQGLPPDSIRSAIRHVLSAAEYDWRPAPRPSLWSKVMSLLARALAWLDHLHETAPPAYYAVIGLMVAILVAIVAHFVYVWWRTVRAVAPPGASPPATGEVIDAAWHLREAHRHGAAGRYAQALGHRYVALMLTLERQRALQFDPSRTPAEYAREMRLDETGRAGFTELVESLYRHLFGGVPCTADTWTEFDQRAERVGRGVATA